MQHRFQINSRVIIPAQAIRIETTRSSGSGGQNVNKVSTKVKIYIHLGSIQGLTMEESRRLQKRLISKVSLKGEILVVSQRTRSQLKNIEDAREKAIALITRSIASPRTRIPTSISTVASDRRIRVKKIRSKIKRERSVKNWD
jgi:ribosome-associated protein